MEQATDQQLLIGKWMAAAAAGAFVMYMLDPERGAARRAQSGRRLRGLQRQGSGMVDRLASGIGARASEAGSAIRKAAAEASSTVHDLASQAGAAAQPASAAAQAATGVAHAGVAISHAARQADSLAADTASASGGASRPQHDSAAGALMPPVQNLISQARQLGSSVSAGLGSVFGNSASQSSAFAAGTGAAQRARGTPPAATTLAGAALALYGLLGRRTPLAMAAGVAGLALLARGAGGNGAASRAQRHGGASLRSMLASANPARPVVVEKTIRIDASPEQVYDLFANYENFPRYMSNVMEVRDLGDRRSHWVVRGPAGTHFQWNAVLTESTRPRRLAWESEPGAEVEQTGTILFEPFRNGTRVTVHMSYRPPAGMVGHALASLLGSDPKQQMDEDLARMKSLVERGSLAPRSVQTGGAGHTSHAHHASGSFLH